MMLHRPSCAGPLAIRRDTVCCIWKVSLGNIFGRLKGDKHSDPPSKFFGQLRAVRAEFFDGQILFLGTNLVPPDEKFH